MKVVCSNCEAVFNDKEVEGKGTLENPWICPNCGHKLRMVTTEEVLEEWRILVGGEEK